MEYIKFLLSLSLLKIAAAIITLPPTWITSPYLKAGSYDVIKTLTGNSSTPTATMPFSAPAFTTIPNLGYGCTAYQGNDYLGSEMYEINRTNLTTSSFSVLVKIEGITNIYLLAVRYVAIDSLFPHSLISFDNVPINYTAGPLTIFATASSTMNTYYNTINFTQQAGSLSYNKFSTPLTNNKIVMFMTSMYIAGANQKNTSYNNPVSILTDYQIMSTTTYRLRVQFGTMAVLTRLHLSMIIFDQIDVEKSGLYMLIYERVDIPNTGGFIPLPQQFVNNLIIGLTNFTTVRTRSIIHFQWNFTSVSGQYGLQMPLSIPWVSGASTIDLLGFTYFYLKTWICPSQTYFDPAQNLCSGCPIHKCVDCYNISVCQLCEEGDGYFLNKTTGKCDRCISDGCFNCSQLNSTYTNNITSNGSICFECDISNNYRLAENDTCQRCKTENNYFLNVSSMLCELCPIEHCLVCANLSVCLNCDLSNFYYLDGVDDSACAYCDWSMNLLINTTDNICYLCQLNYCLNCSTLETCAVCDQQNNYFLNQSNFLCQQCVLEGCQQCINLTACFRCDRSNGYVLNYTTLLCQSCSYSQSPECFDDFEPVLKKTQCNQFLIIINSPPLPNVEHNIKVLNPGVFIKSINSSGNKVNIQFIYGRTLNNQNIELLIFGVTVQVSFHNFSPLVYYSSQECSNVNNIEKLLEGILISSYFILALSLVSCKIVGLELFGVLQLAYYSLSSYDFMILYFQPLSKFKIFNGANINLFTQKTALPVNFSQIGLSSYFLNNCNIMLLLTFGELILAALIFFVGWLFRYNKVYYIGLRLLKQGFMTLLLFNAFNIAYSTGIQLKYVVAGDKQFWMSTGAMIITGLAIFMACLAIELTSPEGYGQFKDKFKSNYISKFYIVLSMLYRVILGLYSSTNTAQHSSTLVVLAYSFIFILYNLVNLPFLQVYQNYRATFMHFSQMIILVIANYYRSIKKYTPLEIKVKIYIPAWIQLGILVLCVVVSVGALAYEIYREVRGYNKGLINCHNSRSKVIQQSLATIQ